MDLMQCNQVQPILFTSTSVVMMFFFPRAFIGFGRVMISAHPLFIYTYIYALIDDDVKYIYGGGMLAGATCSIYYDMIWQGFIYIVYIYPSWGLHRLKCCYIWTPY